jgi:ABC-2 type transport system ATP-binding protein
VLEIVERLCTHIAIIAEGRLVTSGPLDELRRGIAAAGGRGAPLSLEDYFISVVGGGAHAPEAGALAWLG